MRGTLTFSYRIPPEHVATAIEVAPHTFSASPNNFGIGFSIYLGEEVSSETHYAVRTELETAFTAAGVGFEYAAYGKQTGDNLPWFQVDGGVLEFPTQVRAWSADEAVQQVREILSIPEGAFLQAEPVADSE